MLSYFFFTKIYQTYSSRTNFNLELKTRLKLFRTCLVHELNHIFIQISFQNYFVTFRLSIQLPDKDEVTSDKSSMLKLCSTSQIPKPHF